jgi:hypothetical protein
MRTDLLPAPTDLLAEIAADPVAAMAVEARVDTPIELPQLPAGNSADIFALDLPPLQLDPAAASGVEPPLSPPSIDDDAFADLTAVFAPTVDSLARLGYDPQGRDPLGLDLRAQIRRIVRSL